MSKHSISDFIDRHYRHFNTARLVEAAKAYRQHLDGGGRMLITLAGAMSTGELGISLAEMIRQGEVHGISTTGANLEEDIFNLVAHEHYVQVPNYRELTAADEVALLDKGLNRTTIHFRRKCRRRPMCWMRSSGRGTMLIGPSCSVMPAITPRADLAACG